jgi:hypothetical protein
MCIPDRLSTFGGVRCNIVSCAQVVQVSKCAALNSSDVVSSAYRLIAAVGRTRDAQVWFWQSSITAQGVIIINIKIRQSEIAWAMHPLI